MLNLLPDQVSVPTLPATEIIVISEIIDYIENYRPPLDPKRHSIVRRKAYIKKINKGEMNFQLINPKGLGFKLFKVQGETEDICINRWRDKMRELVKELAADIVISNQDKRDAQDARTELAKAGLSGLRLARILTLGLMAFLARPTDPEAIIREGEADFKRRETTLREAIHWYLTNIIGNPRNPPLMEHRTQKSFVGAILNGLCGGLKAGAATSLMGMIRDDAEFSTWFSKYVLTSEGGWGIKYRRKAWTEIKRFFRDVCPKYGITSPVPGIFGKCPKCETHIVVAIPPDVIAKMLGWMRRKRPDLLLYALLQIYCGLRPEEAWKFLPFARAKINLQNGTLVVPNTITKGRRPRIIRLRPAFLAWLNYVPGWVEGSTREFRPRATRCGGFVGPEGAQNLLNNRIRLAGWGKQRIPTESLRKSFLSACVALRILQQRILDEAGHANAKTLKDHYDADWCQTWGALLFSIFPEPPAVMPSLWNLHRAYGQKPTDIEPDNNDQDNNYENQNYETPKAA